jgi:DNA topoisomerase-3
MQIAEQLYSKGYISYPRTETEKFHPSMDLRGLVRIQTTSRDWGLYAESLLGGGRFTSPRNGQRDDQAHPPIHPLKCGIQSDFDSIDEWKIFELISRHFLACVSPDAQGSSTRIVVGLTKHEGSHTEKFHLEGLVVLEKNWLEIYPYARWGNTGDENQLPNVVIGERIPVVSLDVTEGHTEPPSGLTEEELIDLMDKNGIGTDATMHEHIRTIQDRGYCWQDSGRKFVPSPLGIALVVGVGAYANDDMYHLGKPTLRSEMERDMGLISRGSLDRYEFINRYVRKMKEIFLNISDNPRFLDLEIDRVCDGSVQRTGRDGTDDFGPGGNGMTIRQGQIGYGRVAYVPPPNGRRRAARTRTASTRAPSTRTTYRQRSTRQPRATSRRRPQQTF